MWDIVMQLTTSIIDVNPLSEKLEMVQNYYAKFHNVSMQTTYHDFLTVYNTSVVLFI